MFVARGAHGGGDDVVWEPPYLIQKMALPTRSCLKYRLSISVSQMSGIWSIRPQNAHPLIMCSGTPTSTSWSTADTKKTTMPAMNLLTPKPVIGKYTCLAFVRWVGFG